MNKGEMNACHAAYIPKTIRNIRQAVPPISPAAILTFVRMSKNLLTLLPHRLQEIR